MVNNFVHDPFSGLMTRTSDGFGVRWNCSSSVGTEEIVRILGRVNSRPSNIDRGRDLTTFYDHRDVVVEDTEGVGGWGLGKGCYVGFVSKVLH